MHGQHVLDTQFLPLELTPALILCCEAVTTCGYSIYSFVIPEYKHYHKSTGSFVICHLEQEAHCPERLWESETWNRRVWSIRVSEDPRLAD